MNDKQKMYTYWGIGIVVVVALIVWWAIAAHHKNSAPSGTAVSGQAQTAMSPTPTSTPTATPTAATNPAAASTYGAAVAAHPYRIQFSTCHGTPGTLQVAKGDVVMLDNRDAAAHTIVADSQTFKVPGYGWALLHTSAVESSSVTCDGGGAATLNVQK
jgi:plastocyanin